MLKRKIIVLLIALFSGLLLYFFPKEKLKIKKQIIIKNNTSVYLLDKNNYVSLTNIKTNKKEIYDKIKEIVEDLKINNPSLPNGFQGLLNPDTEIINLSLENNLLKINFTKSFLDAGNEEKMLESLIYSLTSLKEIDKIIIYVEGNILTKLPKSGIILPSTLDREIGINKEYTFNNLNDVKDVTIYYLKENNNKEYYIPVTKYLNSDKTKEEIIIDELKKNSLDYKSYLDYNLKIENKEIKNNNLRLTLNRYVFSDNEKYLSDEVGESLALSFKDTLNIKSVSLISNNKTIYKI